MQTNQSIPRCTVIPELVYPNLGEAIEWLCGAFGFTLRLLIADHRAQLNAGDGAVVLKQSEAKPGPCHSVMVRVEDAVAHHARAVEHGARVLGPPADYPYGERQYNVEDLAGHLWTFTQTVADVDPREWGGTPGEL